MDMTKQCAPGENYCMTDILQDAQGNVDVYKRCATEHEMRKDWIFETADQDFCKKYGVVKNPSAFSCHFGCVGDSCNSDMLPDEKTWYKLHNRRLAAGPPANTNIYAAELPTTMPLGPDGKVVPVIPPRKVRKIRVWAGKAQGRPGPEIKEIQPLRKKTGKPTHQLVKGPTSKASANGDPHFKAWDGSKFDFQ